MSEPLSDLDLLRSGGSPSRPGAAQAAAAGVEVFVRHAKRANQHVVTFRCLNRGADCIVECDVYPVDSLRVEPLRAGPYTFAGEHEARQFADEATLALEYLGCEIVNSRG
ncbi:MAG: hypothetical protein ACRDN6_11545 [Gaiellaceae bacterium]